MSSKKISTGPLFTNKEAANEFASDLSQWRVRVDKGTHNWVYAANDEQPQTFYEKYWLGLPVEMPEQPKPVRPSESFQQGWEFVKQLQTNDGCWGTNCDGPMYSIAGVVFAMYISGYEIERNAKLEMIRFLANTRNDDGGWGTTLDEESSLFGTVINYVALRFMGLGPEHAMCTKARHLIKDMGGILPIQTWGKWWMCVLNLYDWDGMIPLTPELFLTPRASPLSPANWWMPIRNVFVGMAYLYGQRYQLPANELVRALRKELYDEPYADINWRAQRTNIAAKDRLKPMTFGETAATYVLGLLEDYKLPFLRKRALKETLFHIEAEVYSSGYCCIAPVTWAVNLICLWHAYGTTSLWCKRMTDHWLDGLWMCREGLQASGTDGTAVWDTSFTVQAFTDLPGVEATITDADKKTLEGCLRLLDYSQLQDDPIGMEHVWRHPAKGGWPFGTRNHGYVVSDTTSEAIRAILRIQKLPGITPLISRERLQQGIDALLGLESDVGGFGAFEKVRGSRFLELVNITDTYENCMRERRYPECTAAVLKAFTEFRAAYPDYRAADIAACTARSIAYLERSQDAAGGWEGSWAICYSYATCFALEGFATQGLVEANHASVRCACAYLLAFQNADGGWGESIESSRHHRYVQEPAGSQVPQTAYCVLALLAAQSANHAAIERGVRYLMRAQQPAGDWLPGKMEGIYTPPAAYRYPMYKFHFTLKALAGYIKRYGDKPLME